MTVEDTAPGTDARQRVEASQHQPTASLDDSRGPGRDGIHRHPVSRATIAVAFAVLLLVLATTSQGAFAISRWAPLALFVLALLLGAALISRGTALPASRAARVALVAIWGLAAWSVLSMLWAQSSGLAFQGADRMILYAAIVTLPFALPVSRSALSAVAWALSAGIGAIAIYVVIHLQIDGTSMFLAGRLNGPINYRNGTALLFAIPVWPFIIAAAARANRRPIRALALALASLCLGLTFLTQSRGILIGLGVGGCVAVTMGEDRVRRAWLAIVAVGGVALASHWLLRPYHAFTAGRFASIPHQIGVAGGALALLTVISFVVGMLLALFDQGLRADSPEMNGLRRLARIALVTVVVLGLVGAAASIGNPVTFARHKWNEFRDLNGAAPTSTRYVSVSGQRYDLWRVALKEFGHAPVLGVGADNYAFGYYRDRATNRNLNDPHSLLFSLLSELGIVGAGLFVAFIGGLVAAVGRGWRKLGSAHQRAVVAAAAGGTVLLGQSMVDWIWLIPGLTAIGLFLLSVAAAQSSGAADAADAEVAAATNGRRPMTGASPRRGLPRGYFVLRAVAVGGLMAAMAGVLGLFLSDAYVQRARSAIYNPRAELSAAKLAGTFDPWAVDPHYLEASAYETMGNRASASQQLDDALALEPANSATLGVLGDFEARAGNFAAARAYYRRALALNPLDVGLQQLARIGETSRVSTARGARPHR